MVTKKFKVGDRVLFGKYAKGRYYATITEFGKVHNKKVAYIRFDDGEKSYAYLDEIKFVDRV
jgi:hypothetical protein